MNMDRKVAVVTALTIATGLIRGGSTAAVRREARAMRDQYQAELRRLRSVH